MIVAEQIKGYLDRVEDIDYLERILGDVPLPELFQVLLQLIRSSSGDEFARADVFIRDVSYRTADRSRFREELVLTEIRAAYVRNIFAKNYYIRRTALSTLTIFRHWWSQKEIESAIAFLESNDPILLSALTKDEMMRNRYMDWRLPKRLINSHDFLVRWSVVESLDNILKFPLPEDKILSEARFCLERLRQDGKESVRVEAEFLCERIKTFEAMLTLPKLEKRKLSKALNKATPKKRFDNFKHFVGWELPACQAVDFTMAELHKFAEVFAASTQQTSTDD